MTNNRKKMSDDEYQFPEEEYVGADSVSTDGSAAAEDDVDLGSEPDEAIQKPSRVGAIFNTLRNSPFLQNKRLLLVAGAAVVALIAFKVMTPSHHKTQPKKQQTVVRAQPKQTVQQTVNPQVQEQMAALHQNAKQNQENINQMQQELQTLRASLQQSESQQSQMNQDMTTLVNQVKKLNAEVKAAQPKKKVKKGPVAPKLVYYIKAIIPGRAWLINNFGQTTTVAVGNKLKQYGQVEAIDVQQGEIVTTSGKVIHYGPDDS